MYGAGWGRLAVRDAGSAPAPRATEPGLTVFGPLFHDEDAEYARRLSDSGVPCDLDVIPGAFHGFDLVFPKAEISREFWRRQARALKGAL
ncbi:hypothetical protein OG828_31960 [Streptomyces sp. NBC_00457]|uniref:hypothetical protein n=1 Tax=unclassified Streptomyces TaxID=2593676 RepID=UPI002E24ECA0|nr:MULTISPECIES: hypothetical protein [unclassified Streptomyces]